MTPAARISALIELVDQFLQTSTPADVLATKYVRQRRFIGSKDRQYITQHFFSFLRHFFQLKWQLNQEGTLAARALVFMYFLQNKTSMQQLDRLCDGAPYHPDLISIEEKKVLEKSADLDLSRAPHAVRLGLPKWLYAVLKETFGPDLDAEIEALDQQAPLDIRVNSLKTSLEVVSKTFKEDSISFEKTPYAPWGLRLHQRQPLSKYPAFKKGHIEIQDAGAQLIAILCAVQPGMRVLDYCAGAGGKTLALAAEMQNKGTLLATDVLDWRLQRAVQRLRRSGVSNTQCRTLDETAQTKSWIKRQHGRFDRVLLDVPCSGTGTWRRNPDLKIRLTTQTVTELKAKQQKILQAGSAFVKPGGRLIYATCSILSEENDAQIQDFLEKSPHFNLLSIKEVWQQTVDVPYPTHKGKQGVQLTPNQHGTDGFYVAVLEKK